MEMVRMMVIGWDIFGTYTAKLQLSKDTNFLYGCSLRRRPFCYDFNIKLKY